MRTYKVKFIYASGDSIETTIDHPNGFIDGYRTARRAKEVVEKVNKANKANTGVSAEYLGRER